MTAPAYSIQHFLDMQQDAAARASVIASLPEEDRRYTQALFDIFSTLLESPTFRASILDYKSTTAMFYPLRWANLGKFTVGSFSQRDGAVTLNTYALDVLGLGEMTRVCAHEYRHVWQATQKILARLFERFGDQVRSIRRTEGDAVAFELTVAYELKLFGRPSVWAESLPTLTREFPESTRAFLTALENDPGSLWTGEAQNAALLAWQENRTRHLNYERHSEPFFKTFNSMSDKLKRHVRKTASRSARIDQLLYSMPYIDGDGVRKIRPRYGRFTQLQRQRLDALSYPQSLSRNTRLDAWVDARQKAKKRAPRLSQA